ncbi:MAG: Fic family protein [Alphaproteobacteria bacterium]
MTNRLLVTMRRIGEAIGEIRALGLNRRTLARLEREARELATHASTSIEGNPLPLTDVKRLLKAAPIHMRDTEREILNYNRALQEIHAAVKSGRFRLDIPTMERIQGIVVDGLLPNPGHIGALRKEPVLIRDPRRPDAVVFIPPDHGDVPELTRELAGFVARNDAETDPIILAGLFHRQFVIVHPFMDGNGRTARLLTTAILGLGGLDIFEIFAFENYYNRNVSRYFQTVGLQGDYYELAKDIDFTAWLEYFADGILDELRRVRGAIPQGSPVRLEEHHRRLLDYIDAHGSISQREYGRISNRSLAARKQDFQKLLDEGLIQREGGGRSIYYVRAED